MDLHKQWNELRGRYADEKARLIEYLESVSPASDEYTRAVDNLRTLETVESQDAGNLLSAMEKNLEERKTEIEEARDEREAGKPEIGRKDLLQILVPAGCVLLTLGLEFGANGVVTSKVFQKLPFFR